MGAATGHRRSNQYQKMIASSVGLSIICDLKTGSFRGWKCPRKVCNKQSRLPSITFLSLWQISITHCNRVLLASSIPEILSWDITIFVWTQWPLLITALYTNPGLSSESRFSSTHQLLLTSQTSYLLSTTSKQYVQQKSINICFSDEFRPTIQYSLHDYETRRDSAWQNEVYWVRRLWMLLPTDPLYHHVDITTVEYILDGRDIVVGHRQVMLGCRVASKSSIAGAGSWRSWVLHNQCSAWKSVAIFLFHNRILTWHRRHNFPVHVPAFRAQLPLSFIMHQNVHQNCCAHMLIDPASTPTGRTEKIIMRSENNKVSQRWSRIRGPLNINLGLGFFLTQCVASHHPHGQIQDASNIPYSLSMQVSIIRPAVITPIFHPAHHFNLMDFTRFFAWELPRLSL